MAKNTSRLFRAVIMAAVVLLLMSACDNNGDDTHEHAFGEWTVEKEATCTEEGVKVRYCECGEKETETIAASGHVRGELITDVEATCTEKGKKHLICAVCGETIGTQSVSARGHISGEYIVDLEPTCTKSGKKHLVCKMCRETINSTYIYPKGHTAEEWIIDSEPTDTEPGSKHQVCSVCGEIFNTVAIMPNVNPGHGGGNGMTINEIGAPYTDKNGLTVTLNSYTAADTGTYYTYTINYTIANNVPDSKLMPGTFKLFFTDDSGENQYGIFNYLFCGDSVSNEYTWKVQKTKTVLILEYNADSSNDFFGDTFFRDKPIKDAMHWQTPVI